MRPACSAVALGLLTLLLAACSTGGVNSIWTEPGGAPSPYRKLAVIGIANKTSVQRAYEDNFIGALKAIGVTASSGQAVASAANRTGDQDIRKALEHSGADGILVTHLIAEPARNSEPPARATAIPQAYRRLDLYYNQVYREVMTPGYYADYQKLRLESNLYDAKRATLVWSGRSQPLDPNSERTIGQIIAEVVAQLRRDGYLP